MKLYVGNLPFSTTDDGLKELFSTHGHVTSARVVTDRMSGRSRGFGFVEFDEATEAQEAIAAINGKEFGGRALVVNEARPEGARGGGRGPGAGRGGGRGGFGGDRGGFGGDRGGFGGDWGGRGFGNERRDRSNRGRGSHGGGRGRGSGGRDDY